MARGQYSQWYADRKWRAKRKLQLQIEPLCEFCQSRGILKPADVVDHVEPHRGDRAKFWDGALQSLCHTCHSSTKARIENGTDAGCDEQGNPYAPNEHWR